jgi:hypothetical protein
MPSDKLSRRSRSTLLTYAIVILALMVIGTSYRHYVAQGTNMVHREVLLPIEGQQSPETAIEVGLLIDNVYAFEADKKTFDADGWIWLKWSQALHRKMLQVGASPDELFQFFNQVDDWDATLTPGSDAPIPMADGRLYQKFRFSGHFYVNELDFRLYPFQTLKLPLVVELTNEKLKGEGPALGVTLDKVHSGLGDYVDLGGYQTRGHEFRACLHEYKTSFGEPAATSGPRRLPQARMEIAYQKAPTAMWLKVLLPLITVMVLALFAPDISASGWDVRLGIPPMAILTLMFLQQTYQTWMPELPYITFLDTVYNLCYLANLVLFRLFLWGTNEYCAASEEDKPAVVARINRVDLYFQVGITAVIAFTIAANWFTLSRQIQ